MRAWKIRDWVLFVYALAVVALVHALFPSVSERIGYWGAAAVLFAYFLRRIGRAERLSFWVFGVSMLILMERMATSDLLWSAADSVPMAGTWKVFAVAVATSLMILVARSVAWSRHPAVFVMLVSLLFVPPGFFWACFPVFLLILAGTEGLPWTRRNWLWLGVYAWWGFEFVRAGSACRWGDLLTQFVLFLAGFMLGRDTRVTRRDLTLVSGSLIAPIALGLVTTVARHGGLQTIRNDWGLNINLLAAQGGLGFLLLVMLARSRSRRLTLVTGLLALALMAVLGSTWPLLCGIMIVAVSLIPRGKAQQFARWTLVSLPLLVLLAGFLPPPRLPGELALSVSARQFHWKSGILFLMRKPFGGGLGLIHPMALGTVEPRAELDVISGRMMQHAHHFLLHVAEQIGVAGAIVLLVLVVLWARRTRAAGSMSPRALAGYGFLFVWIHNAADMSILSPIMVLVSGFLAGSSLISLHGQVGESKKCPWPMIIPVAALAVTWGANILALASNTALRSGDREKARTAAKVATWIGGYNPTLEGVLADAAEQRFLDAPLHGSLQYPGYVPEMVRIVEQLLRQDRLGKARRLLNKALELDPRGVVPYGGARARVYLSMIATERGKAGGASRIQNGLRWEERDSEIALGAINYWILRGDRVAAESLRVAWLVKTSDSELRRTLARISPIRSDDKANEVAGQQKALDVFDKLRESVERDLRAGRLVMAQWKLKTAPELDRDDWRMLLLGSKVALASGSIDAGISLASQAVVQSGGSDQTRWSLVEALLAGSRNRDAHEQCRRLVDRRPHDGAVWLLLGRTLLELGRAAEARTSFSTALQHGADSLSAGMGMAQAERRSGSTRRARALLVRLADSYPTSVLPFWELAVWAESEGRTQEAFRWARKGLERSPRNPGFNLLAGRLLRRMGRRQQARRHLRSVIEDRSAGPGWVTDAQQELDLIERAEKDPK